MKVAVPPQLATTGATVNWLPTVVAPLAPPAARSKPNTGAIARSLALRMLRIIVRAG
jgi:hypothetical protein